MNSAGRQAFVLGPVLVALLAAADFEAPSRLLCALLIAVPSIAAICRAKHQHLPVPAYSLRSGTAAALV